MAHAVVAGQSIGSAEGFLFGTQITIDLLLASIVNSIFMPSQVVRSRKYCVARFACAGVDAIAAMWSCLAANEA